MEIQKVQVEENSREIAENASGVAVATLVSRVLGLIRDTVIAAKFTSFQTDCFFMAFTIPNVLRRLLGEGALNAAVIPVYADYVTRKNENERRLFLRSLWGSSTGLLFLISFLGVIFSPLIVRLYAWGFTSIPEKFDLTTNLNRVMFPYLFFIGLTALSSGILNVHKKFFTPALSPAIWNIIIIASAFSLPFFLASYGINTIYALAIGVMSGGFIQLIYQFFLQLKTGTILPPKIDLKNEGFKKVIKLMLPLTAGFGIYQLDVLLSRLMASFLPSGSVSYLYYGMRLIDFPQGVLFLAIGTASLPLMAKLSAESDIKNLEKTYMGALSLSLFVSIPATIAFIIMAKPIVSIIFFHGAFTGSMLEPTWMALAAMSPGILGTSIVRVTTPVFYSFMDTKTPVKVSAWNLLIYLFASLVLMIPFKHIGLAIALSIAPITQSLQLIMHLTKKIRIDFKQLILFFLRCTFSSIAMAVFMLIVCSFGKWDNSKKFLFNIYIALLSGAGGISIYLVMCFLSGLKETKLILDIIKSRRLKKQKP